ncbi:MAG: hypothetical protein J0I67_04060 [Bosea sp.]|nr:hypothetical protein [Bosea sp. (in: a-proteobacteria)]
MIISSNVRSVIRRSAQARGIAACLLGLLSMSDLSFAQGARDVCPRGYSIFQTVCLNEVTGDVVNQSREKGDGATPSATSIPDKMSAPVKSGG